MDRKTAWFRKTIIITALNRMFPRRRNFRKRENMKIKYYSNLLDLINEIVLTDDYLCNQILTKVLELQQILSEHFSWTKISPVMIEMCAMESWLNGILTCTFHLSAGSDEPSLITRSLNYSLTPHGNFRTSHICLLLSDFCL